MKSKFHVSSLLFLCIPLTACSQKVDTVKVETNIESYLNKWESIAPGADYMEMDAPKKSILNDSRISILKIDPAQFDLFMLSATADNDTAKTVKEWADKYDLNIVVNAGMYDLAKKLSSKGYLKSQEHCNNPNLYPNYNAMIAFNPIDTMKWKFTVMDLKCETWEKVKDDYTCYAQGLRMIDCNREALGWNKKTQSCSMLVTAVDALGNIYFVFTRSPYTHNDMITFMLNFPFELNSAIYMEGGPQTSLYIHFGDRTIEKVGSYVSKTFANDLNNQFWPLPNVIGLRVKQ